MELKTKYTTVANYEINSNKNNVESFTRSNFYSYSNVEEGKTENSYGSNNDFSSVLMQNIFQVQNTRYRSSLAFTTQHLSESVDGVNKTYFQDDKVQISETFFNRSIIINNGETNRTNKVTTTVDGSTTTSNVLINQDYDNGYETETSSVGIFEGRTIINNVYDVNGITKGTTVENIYDGSEESYESSEVIDYSTDGTFVIAVEEDEVRTYSTAFLNKVRTTINSTVSFPQRGTLSISRNGSTFTSLTTIQNLTTCKSNTFINSFFTYTFPFFAKSFGTNTESYEIGIGKVVTKYTINTFIEDYHNDLERFMVYKYAGGYNDIPPILKFSDCFSTVAGQHQWTDETRTLDLGTTSSKEEYGEGSDSTIVIEVTPEQAIDFENVYRISSSDDSNYFKDAISTYSTTIAGSSTSRGNNQFNQYRTATRTATKTEAYTFVSVELLQTDPKNFITTQLNKTRAKTVTFNSSFFNGGTRYLNSTGSSGSSSSSTSGSNSGETVYNSTGSFRSLYFSNSGQTGRGFSFGRQITYDASGRNVQVITTNEAFDVNLPNHYAIVPDFKKGVLGFSSNKLYEGFSVSYESSLGIFPITISCLFKNKNQTKILGFACQPFVDYETGTISKNISSAYPVTFVSTDSSHNEDGDLYSYSSSYITNATSFESTTLTTRISYIPTFDYMSSVVNDKSMQIKYSVTRRKNGSTTVEERNTLHYQLLNSCSNSVNFRRDTNFLGGHCPQSSQKWTLYYMGHLFATKYLNGSSSTLELFNPSDSFSSREFSDGEAVFCESRPVYRVGSGDHYKTF